MAMHIQHINIKIITGCVLALSIHSTAFARILTNDEVSQADTQNLIAETAVFKSIGMGIALSLANCEGAEDCRPAVNEEELKQLLDALDERISHLQGIVESEEVSEESLGDILTAYVDERENYLRYLDKLGEIAPAIEQQMVEEPAMSEDVFRDIDEEVQDFSVFEDANDDLQDESDDSLEVEEDLPPEEL